MSFHHRCAHGLASDFGVPATYTKDVFRMQLDEKSCSSTVKRRSNSLKAFLSQERRTDDGRALTSAITSKKANLPLPLKSHLGDFNIYNSCRSRRSSCNNDARFLMIFNSRYRKPSADMLWSHEIQVLWFTCGLINSLGSDKTTTKKVSS